MGFTIKYCPRLASLSPIRTYISEPVKQMATRKSKQLLLKRLRFHSSIPPTFRQSTKQLLRITPILVSEQTRASHRHGYIYQVFHQAFHTPQNGITMFQQNTRAKIQHGSNSLSEFGYLVAIQPQSVLEVLNSIHLTTLIQERLLSMPNTQWMILTVQLSIHVYRLLSAQTSALLAVLTPVLVSLSQLRVIR